MPETAFGLLRYQYPADVFLVVQRFDVAGVGDELKYALESQVSADSKRLIYALSTIKFVIDIRFSILIS